MPQACAYRDKLGSGASSSLSAILLMIALTSSLHTPSGIMASSSSA